MKYIKYLLISLMIINIWIMPLSATRNSLAYNPNRNDRTSFLKDLTCVALGVGLCIGAGLTSKCTLASYKELSDNATIANFAMGKAKDGITSWFRGKQQNKFTIEKFVNLFKHYGSTIFWGTSTISLGVSGLYLITQGLHLKEEQQ